MKVNPTPDHADSPSATTTVVNSPVEHEVPRLVATSQSSDIFSNDSDEEDGNDVQGWPQLAQLMAKTPDLAAFPRFRDLNVKSLLYYQCELDHLRRKLRKLERTDKVNNKYYAEYADDLVVGEKGVKSEQFQTIKDIRRVLKEYSMCRRSIDTFLHGNLTRIQIKQCCSTLKYVHCRIPSHTTCALCGTGYETNGALTSRSVMRTDQ